MEWVETQYEKPFTTRCHPSLYIPISFIKYYTFLLYTLDIYNIRYTYYYGKEREKSKRTMIDSSSRLPPSTLKLISYCI